MKKNYTQTAFEEARNRKDRITHMEIMGATRAVMQAKEICARLQQDGFPFTDREVAGFVKQQFLDLPMEVVSAGACYGAGNQLSNPTPRKSHAGVMVQVQRSEQYIGARERVGKRLYGIMARRVKEMASNPNRILL
ncbi:MAG: hypothetical protein ABIG28_03005 [archaeon]